MGPLGIPEMIFIFIFALIVFGPKKLPELGRTFGKGMAEFRRASSELKSTFQREMDNIERETRMDEARKAANEAKKAIAEATSVSLGSSPSQDSSRDYDYYDGYDPEGYGGRSAASSAASASVDETTEPAPSTGGSTGNRVEDYASATVETPSNDSSSSGPVAMRAESLDDDVAVPAEKAAEQGAA